MIQSDNRGASPENAMKSSVPDAGVAPSVAPVVDVCQRLAAGSHNEPLRSAASLVSLPASATLPIAIFWNCHNDFGSRMQTLRARFDLTLAIVSGNPRWLSRGWDEVYIQDSTHHEGTCEIIRARGKYGDPGSDFTVLGVPVETFAAHREIFARLRAHFPPPDDAAPDTF